ncbi:MAG: transposase [Bacteroidota bacterium]
MSSKDLLEVYIDYLMISTGQVSATGLSRLVDSAFSHDQVTRMLSESYDLFTSSQYWKRIKPLVRKVEAESGMLIADDFVCEKPHSKENELISYHYSHLHGKPVKGINIVHLQYSVQHECQDVNFPVGFDLVRKSEFRPHPETGERERYSPKDKNARFRDLLHGAHFMHHIPFEWVMADSWYANVKNLRYIAEKLKKDFLFGLKSNRKVALSKGQARRKDFVKLSTLSLQPGEVRQIWLDRLPFPLYVCKEIYVNKDQSTGELFLVTNREGMTYQQIISLYPERWRIEPSHKSLKNNASLQTSPTKVPTTQANHIFAAFCALVQFEALKIKTKLNHFALKSKLYAASLKEAFKELQEMKCSISSA